jgi:hypothetical protein
LNHALKSQLCAYEPRSQTGIWERGSQSQQCGGVLSPFFAAEGNAAYGGLPHARQFGLCLGPIVVYRDMQVQPSVPESGFIVPCQSILPKIPIFFLTIRCGGVS